MILHFEASCVDIEFCGTTGHKIPAIENLGVAGVSQIRTLLSVICNIIEEVIFSNLCLRA